MTRIEIETTGGQFSPKDQADYTLDDILAIRRLPANLFQAYIVDGDTSRCIPTDTTLAELGDESHVVLRCVMNPNFAEFMEIITSRHRRDGAVTTIEDYEFGQDGCEKIVHEIDPPTAREIVADRVLGFMGRYGRPGPLLAGVSGGGDSNAMIEPLHRAATQCGAELIAYTLVCDPIWPETSASRAAALCASAGVRHLIVDGPVLADLLGLSTDVATFYHGFLEKFGRKTAHFFATYLISLSARRLGKKYGAPDYCLGFNREDVLAEAIFCLLNGRRPLAYPVRDFGTARLLMPVWEVPKLVLDSCYPAYSLANYEDRIGTTPQRGLIYYLAHSLEGIYSNFGLSLLTGVSQMIGGDWPELQSQGAFDLYPAAWASDAQVSEVEAFLAQYIAPSP